MSYRFNRKKFSQEPEDIYDGELYKEFVVINGIFSSQNNISFTFNTDRATVFKSSNYLVWPIYLVINELEPKLIYNKICRFVASYAQAIHVVIFKANV